MLALGIRYLNGFVAATEPDSRERPEWPPHPGRVFMALAAAHFCSEGDAGERAALEWLESLPAPSIQVSDSFARCAVTHYVPVNDLAGDARKPPTTTLQSVPVVARDRQPRTFARAWLEDEVVYLQWPLAQPSEEQHRALESLCARVTRIGHSTSLVQMWLAGSDEAVVPNWVPNQEGAEIHLRVTGQGTLQYLARCFNAEGTEAFVNQRLAEEEGSAPSGRRGRAELGAVPGNRAPTRLRPSLPLYQGYARPAAPVGGRAIAGTVFSPRLLVFRLARLDGPCRELDLAATLLVTQRWREALLANANDASESTRCLVSGHAADGAPLAKPHAAFLPLASAGHSYADGHLLGVAVALPVDLAASERQGVLQVLSRVKELRLGGLGVWRLEPETSLRPAWNLHSEAWTAAGDGATHWSTVTPIAFDRHSKAKDRREHDRECADAIGRACEAVGVGRPRQVLVTTISAHLGVPPAPAFPRIRRKDGSERRHAHAILIFEHSVRGPLLLGAGRYRGYGLCRPIRQQVIE